MLAVFEDSLILATCGGNEKDNEPSGPQEEREVTYGLTFIATWNQSDFPKNFAGYSHFYPIVEEGDAK